MKMTSDWWKGVLALLALSVIGLVAPTGCSSSAREIPFKTISKFPVSDYKQNEPKLVLIPDRSELELLAWLASDSSDLEKAMNETDFSDDCLLVAFHGEKGSGGYGIEISSIQRSGTRIEARARFTSPEAGSTLDVTSPYHLVQLRKTDLGSGRLTFTLVDDSSGKTVARATYTLP